MGVVELPFEGFSITGFSTRLVERLSDPPLQNKSYGNPVEVPQDHGKTKSHTTASSSEECAVPKEIGATEGRMEWYACFPDLCLPNWPGKSFGCQQTFPKV